MIKLSRDAARGQISILDAEAFGPLSDNCGAFGDTAEFVMTARQNLVDSPGGYLRGMIRKAEAGALDLQKSVFGLT